METLEELAVKIQAGQNDLYPVLWKRIKRFVRWRAFSYIKDCRGGFDGRGFGCIEDSDLIQSGFLALVEAVEHFDPAKGSFLSVYGFYLKKAFREAVGIRTSKRDCLDYCISSDRPSKPGDAESDPISETYRYSTLSDAGKNDLDLFEDAEHRIYQEQLHNALEAALARIPAKQAEAVRRSFYGGETFDEIGKSFGVSRNRANQLVTEGLKTMREERCLNRLDEFLDFKLNYYRGGGFNVFERSKTSSTERYALLRAECEEIFKRHMAEMNG